LEPNSRPAPEWQKRALRVAGFAFGLACFGGAIWVAVREREEFAQALEALRDPPMPAVVAVLASVAVGAFLSAVLFHILMRRFGSVPFWEMQALILASTLANYLPLKPGLVGRVAYHRLRHGIKATDSVRTVVEAVGLSGSVSAMFLLGLAGCRALGINGDWSLLAPSVLGAAAFHPRLRTLAQALFVRQIERALWTLRYWAVFRLVGAPIDLEVAVVLGSASVIATLVPFVSNGLGIREWVIGLLAPWVSHQELNFSQAIVGELVHRVMEIAVMLPLGLVSLAVLVRHNRRHPMPQA